MRLKAFCSTYIAIALSCSYVFVGNVRASMTFHLATGRGSSTIQKNSKKQRKRSKPTRVVNQKIQGSPGAIQAGRDVKINLNTEPKLNDPYTIHIVCLKDLSASVSTYRFPYSDIKPNSDHAAFIKLIRSLPNLPCNIDSVTVFRLIDEEILRIEGKQNATSNGNNGVLIIIKDVLDGYGTTHLAFSQIKSFIDGVRSQQRHPDKESPPSVTQNMNNSPELSKLGVMSLLIGHHHHVVLQ